MGYQAGDKKLQVLRYTVYRFLLFGFERLNVFPRDAFSLIGMEL